MKTDEDFDEEYKNDDRELPSGDNAMENLVVGVVVGMFVVIPIIAFIFG